jgi:hypothetical protein
MKKVFGALLGVALLISSTALAQSKTIPGDTVTKTATIEAINHGTRELTIKGPDGNFVTFTASADVKRFDALKVGDTITVKYYENVVVRMKKPGEKDVDTATAADTKSGGTKPGGTSAEQRTITATITQLDRNVPSITFKGPNNWTYSSRVQDKKAIENVKVGDKVDITWTQAVLIDVTAPAKK